LIPIFGRNDARMNEQIAIGRSLKPSRTLAEDFEIPNSAAPANYCSYRIQKNGKQNSLKIKLP
jgi:hypothetical protein